MGYRSALFFDGIYLSGLLQLQHEFVSFRYYRGAWDKKKCFFLQLVGRWCKENKGTIMGAVLCANGFGGALAAQIVSPIIYEEGNPFGYRNSYYLVAGILLVVGILVVTLFKEKPAEYVEEEAPAKKKASRGMSWSGVEFKEVVRRPYFYLAAGCIFLTGLMLQGTSGVSAAHMKDIGLTPEYVAAVMSISSLALAAFKFLTGVMYDRFGLRITMSICDAAAVIIMVLLSCMAGTQSGRGVAMMYAVLSGLALPLETIMLPIFANDLFGDKSYEKVMGIFVSVNTAGFAAGTPVMNWCFDTFGTYKPAFVACAGIMAVVMVVFQFVLSAADKGK